MAKASLPPIEVSGWLEVASVSDQICLALAEAKDIWENGLIDEVNDALKTKPPMESPLEAIFMAHFTILKAVHLMGNYILDSL